MILKPDTKNGEITSDRRSARGEGPVNYLLGEKDKDGVIRNPPPICVKGDPDVTKDLINDIRDNPGRNGGRPQKWTYRGGVLSFKEKVTPDQEANIIGEFEKTFFAGMTEEQYDILWVKHEHTGRTELHFVLPRKELTTDKHFDIFPPGKLYDDRIAEFQNLINARYGLHDPDDPANARDIRLSDFEEKKRAAQKRLHADMSPMSPGDKMRADHSKAESVLIAEAFEINKGNNEMKNVLHELADQWHAAGKLNNREDIARHFMEAGFEVRRKVDGTLTDRFSVKTPDMDKYTRLNGTLYSKDRDWSDTTNIVAFPSKYGRINPEREAAARAALDKIIARCTKTNQKKYGILIPEPALEPTLPEPFADNRPPVTLLNIETSMPELGTSANANPKKIMSDREQKNQAIETWRNAYFNTQFVQHGLRAEHQNPPEVKELWRQYFEKFDEVENFYNKGGEKFLKSCTLREDGQIHEFDTAKAAVKFIQGRNRDTVEARAKNNGRLKEYRQEEKQSWEVLVDVLGEEKAQKAREKAEVGLDRALYIRAKAQNPTNYGKHAFELVTRGKEEFDHLVEEPKGLLSKATRLVQKAMNFIGLALFTEVDHKHLAARKAIDLEALALDKQQQSQDLEKERRAQAKREAWGLRKPKQKDIVHRGKGLEPER